MEKMQEEGLDGKKESSSPSSSMYFVLLNSPQNQISVQVGFKLQTVEIQTAIAVQSDSNCNVQSDSKWRRAIGFKMTRNWIQTADQKIAKLFRLRLFHYTLQEIFKLTFSLYIYTLWHCLKATTSDLSRINSTEIDYTDQRSLQHLFLEDNVWTVQIQICITE